MYTREEKNYQKREVKNCFGEKWESESKERSVPV